MAVDFYSKNALKLFKLYRSLPFESAQCAWLHLIPRGSRRVLDVGAGSGRDAGWFANHGHEVIAVEPATKLRRLAKKSTPPEIRWVNDSLPNVTKTRQLGFRYHVILLSAVWMH